MSAGDTTADATSRCSDTRRAMCVSCGAVKYVSRRFPMSDAGRKLLCGGACRRTTKHLPLDEPRDLREEANARATRCVTDGDPLDQAVERSGLRLLIVDDLGKAAIIVHNEKLILVDARASRSSIAEWIGGWKA